MLTISLVAFLAGVVCVVIAGVRSPRSDWTTNLLLLANFFVLTALYFK